MTSITFRQEQFRRWSDDLIDKPTTSQQLADQIDAELRAAGAPQRAISEKAYLKSELEFYGATVRAVRSVAMAVRKASPEPSHAALIELVELLWSMPVHDRRMAAVELLDAYAGSLEPGDLALIERLIRESKTWALVDGLAANIAGPLVQRFPQLNETLDRWSVDAEFWLRRSALLALLLPLRRGGGDFERFARYADAMVDEKEFFIRKAIGWVLREAAKKQPQRVYDFLAPRTARASGITMREAVKYLPPEQRDELMAAYRGRRANTLSSARGDLT